MIGLVLALAGGLGAVFRFLLDTWLDRLVHKSGLFIINVSGSFLLGLLMGWAAAHAEAAAVARVFGTGFLGGYTTLSAALVDSARLARDGRRLLSLAHAFGMAIPAVAAAALGLFLAT